MSVHDEQRERDSARSGSGRTFLFVGGGLAGAVALNALIYANLQGRLPDFVTYALSALAWLSPPLLAWLVSGRRATEQGERKSSPSKLPNKLSLVEIVGEATRQPTSYSSALAAIIALGVPGVHWAITAAPFVFGLGALVSIIGHSLVGSGMRNGLRKRHFQRVRGSLKIEIDDLQASLVQIASDDVALIEAGRNARSAVERRGIAKKIVRLRKTLSRIEQLLEVRYKQLDIIESYLHQVELKVAVSAFALPSREELLDEASQAVEHAESVADLSEQAASLDQLVLEAVGGDEETERILAEFGATADQASPSERLEAPAKPSVQPDRMEYKEDSAQENGPLAE